jgi:hypothetical protein
MVRACGTEKSMFQNFHMYVHPVKHCKQLTAVINPLTFGTSFKSHEDLYSCYL